MKNENKKIIAKYYKEKLVKTINFEQLYKFKIELSKLDSNKKNIESYYFIDKNDNFWFEELFYSLINNNCFKNAISKYIDSEVENKQIKIFKFVEVKNIFLQDIIDIICSNQRIGIPRKNYKFSDGSLINIIYDDIEELKSIEQAKQLDFFNLLFKNKNII